ncbi:hypothetical protein [Fuchsiella alkaliacetigena]|uniref:hypothetical protein n=1 Tax=Fuchsiella alkaliacetigena TaxID=957042 RepID=UPI00200AF28D|nr:hypothetical protein [Fuchsiella alkaliacetigena]MCK8824672.1 hypothetical protein [Fuchsiella alkaliacetigena]
MKKRILSVMLILVSLLLFNSISYACVGARPLGMGGAFVSVADNVNAIYWNPAGLTQLEQYETTYTRTINNRDMINYNDFIGFAGTNDELGFSYGLGYIGEGQEGTMIDPYYGETEVELSTNWLVFSFGKDLSELENEVFDGLSVGANIRRMSREEEYNPINYQGTASDSDSSIAVDLSALYQINNELSAGLLIQDLFETEFELFDQKISYIRNIRPSVSYQLDDYLTLAFSVYDFRDEFDRNISFGGELEVTAISDLEVLNSEEEKVYVRGGAYQENLTLGAGYEYEDLQFDYAFLGGDLENTHQLGVTYQFEGL